MSLIASIEKEAPKTFKYFQEYYAEHYEGELKLEDFLKLGFGFQLGVFIDFFNSVSTDVELYSNDMNALYEAVLDAFKQYEEYLFLDS